MTTLNRLGTCIKITWLPEYVKARNRYLGIPHWLRWMFPGRRREYEKWLHRQQSAYLDKILGKLIEGCPIEHYADLARSV